MQGDLIVVLDCIDAHHSQFDFEPKLALAPCFGAHRHIGLVGGPDKLWDQIPLAGLEHLQATDSGCVLEFYYADWLFGWAESLLITHHYPAQKQFRDGPIFQKNIIIMDLQLLHLSAHE